MGEIADMMLDGTMDYETGEWNFDGEDGPGFPMTGAEAARFSGGSGWGRSRARNPHSYAQGFKVPKRLRAKIEKLGVLQQHNEWHFQVRREGVILADWWPHKNKWRIGGQNATGDAPAFLNALATAAKATPPASGGVG